MIVEFRAATVADAAEVAEVYLRSRKELVACAPLAHPDDGVRNWIRHKLIPAGRTTVAVVDGRVVGLMAVATHTDCSWITHLYLHPDWIARGIGTQFLERARRDLPRPIRLYTFRDNHRARRFYERYRFEAIAFGDGSGNEERCPDVLYEWRS